MLAGGAAKTAVDHVFKSREQRERITAESAKERERIAVEAARETARGIAAEEINFREALRQQILDNKTDITALKESCKRFEDEASEWRDRYYKALADQVDYSRQYTSLKSDHDELKADYAELTKEFHQLKVKYEDLIQRFEAVVAENQKLKNG